VKHGIEVAHLVNGEVIGVRTLSRRSERRAAGAAAAVVGALTLLTASAVGLGLFLGGRIVHAPTFVSVWTAVGLAVVLLAAARARGQARRYLIGVDIEDDAFAPMPQTLVRRARAGYELSLTAGMTGIVEDGRAPLRIDALVREGRTHVPLESDTRAEITMDATTFVVRARADAGAPIAPLPRGFWRPFVRRALVPIELAALVAFLRAVPAGAALAEADMKSAIPADASPWEVEKLLRLEAQRQARALYACFDPMPLACQHPGYVGVGLSLSREGEIRGSWIARSTYGHDCPVDDCMSKVVSTWYFEPLPESMRIVLPVQVLRTDKPMLQEAKNEAKIDAKNEAKIDANVAKAATLGRNAGVLGVLDEARLSPLAMSPAAPAAALRNVRP
jgi:hypothetical protein